MSLRQTTVTLEAISSLLKGDRTAAFWSDLPRDARVTYIETCDIAAGIVTLYVKSATWAPLAEGEAVPRLEPIHWTRRPIPDTAPSAN